MKIRNLSEAGGRHRFVALTLIEVIGAVAVVGLLMAALLGPTINALNEAKAINAVVAYESLYAAATNHINTYGSFDVAITKGTTATSLQRANWDTQVLMQEMIMDAPFSTKVGQGSVVQVVIGPAANNGSGYTFGGVNNDTAGLNWVVEIVIVGVSPVDAFNVSQLVDGISLTPTNVGMVDTMGRITYDTNQVMRMFVAGGN